MSLADLANLLHYEPSPWTVDPVGWVEQKLGDELWSKQREVLTSVRDNRLTVVPSCVESGKSWTAARAAGWWIDIHAPGEALVVSTADSFRQVRAVMWQEIGQMHRSHRLVGTVNQTEWWIGPRLVGLGVKPADTDTTGLQGLHRRYVLVIVDEADGLPMMMWEAVRSIAVGGDDRILAIGNPVNPASEFARLCAVGSGANLVRINAFESPNFTDEPVSEDLRARLISRVAVDEIRRDFGEESPAWQGRVLGVHPEDSSDGVVRLSTVRACQHMRDGKPVPMEELWEPRDLLPVELGVDVGASAGGDESVITVRFGKRARLLERRQTPDEKVLAGMIVGAVRDTGATKIKIDATGVGWAVAGLVEEGCRQASIPVPYIDKVMVGTASTRPNRFSKLRDQIWWEIGRELSESGGWDLSEIDDMTVSQLVAPRFEPDTAGRTKVEKKDETKKRLGRSPDDADALLLAFYTGARPGTAFSAAAREL